MTRRSGSRDVSAYLDEFAVYEGYARFGEEARDRLSPWRRQLLA
ncbi:hypothetical protein [Streptomyces sp. NPDC015345]|jgi:hypothetical protein